MEKRGLPPLADKTGYTDAEKTAIREELAALSGDEKMRFIMDKMTTGKAKWDIEISPYIFDLDTIDVSKFDLDVVQQAQLQEQLEYLSYYISIPSIKDSFPIEEENHTERRDWFTLTEDIFGDEFREMYKGNKLKWSRTAAVLSAVSFIPQWVDDRDFREVMSSKSVEHIKDPKVKQLLTLTYQLENDLLEITKPEEHIAAIEPKIPPNETARQKIVREGEIDNLRRQKNYGSLSIEQRKELTKNVTLVILSYLEEVKKLTEN